MDGQTRVVGFADSPHFDLHHNGDPALCHPESPQRLHAIREGIEAANLGRHLVMAAPPRASIEQVTAIHSAPYVQRVQQLCAAGGGPLDADTHVGKHSFEAAMFAAGAVIDAVDKVLSGVWQRAFCAVRPPGHHAVINNAMGFCIFDNVAIGAQAALDSGRANKVAIVDFDVHHGNGTQDIFWRRADVFYASTHQYPLYPGTGAADELGEDAGRGSTLNCPLARGAGDAELLRAWETQIRPALERFGPDLILLSAGFDADARDPLAGLCVTASGFERLSDAIVRFADANLGGRVISVLEGGYDLDALKQDVALHVATML